MCSVLPKSINWCTNNKCWLGQRKQYCQEVKGQIETIASRVIPSLPTENILTIARTKTCHLFYITPIKILIQWNLFHAITVTYKLQIIHNRAIIQNEQYKNARAQNGNIYSKSRDENQPIKWPQLNGYI